MDNNRHEEYDDAYNNLKNNADFQYVQYIDKIESLKKYLDEDVVDSLKITLVNASRNQGTFKEKILKVLDKKLNVISEEVKKFRETVGSIHKIDENEEYGGKGRRKNKKTNNRRKSHRVKKTYKRRKY
jgi:RNAse (barnase) inhibitor barstar